MKAVGLCDLLIRFFNEHLHQQRNVSRHTLLAYRDTFRLLLRFFKRTYRIPPATLELSGLNPDRVLAFLAHLEQHRGNQVRSRNARLAAIRTFVHYAEDLLGPDLPGLTRRLLAIPFKRYTRPILGFLTRAEIGALLAAVGQNWTGRRDYLLFLLLYNTGARISEILGLRMRDVLVADCRHLALQGKGRKQRSVPLWPSTQTRLRQWIKENPASPDAPLLPNRFGQPLTRSGAAWQLRQLVRRAATQMPSLRQRRISPHTLRHTTAMHLLQGGVAPEIIALWLGHESPNTTHLYVEADLMMKRQALQVLDPPKSRHLPKTDDDHLFQFLDHL
jgi:site-specific recombinase XerD